jgi:phospholipase C
VLKFVEDNWKTGPIGNYSFDEKAGSLNTMFDFDHSGKKTLYLDPQSGQPTKN